jgi:KipI family sensor histidine kinase inhibitor
MEPVFDMLGDRALLVTLSRDVSREVNDQALGLARAVERAAIPGVDEAQPAYSSFCVHFDPARVRRSYIEAFVRRIMEDGGTLAELEGAAPRLVEIPVAYGGEEGPDLEWSARHLGISPEELVRRHTARAYRVFMVGFTPGFPYLGGMDETIALPRLPEPRSRVAAGSVGIGGNQTGIYPWETPGGWRLLGRTGVELFSPSHDDPSLLHPGDEVRFVAGDRGAGGGGRPGASTREGGPGAAAPSQIGVKQGVPSVMVEHPGFFTIVVDEGRFGYRKIGVPVSGAADLRSYHLANLLCGNAAGGAALEITLLGGKFGALTDLTVAVTGAPAPVRVDGVDSPMNSPLFVPRGTLLEVGSLQAGCRSYLAVAGGIEVPLVLRSRSTYPRGKFGGYQGRSLRPGDTLSSGPAPEHAFIVQHQAESAGSRDSTPGPTDPWNNRGTVLRVLPGPEAEPSLLTALCSDSYTVNPESDRMGLRFAGPDVPAGKGDILSSPVVPGTVQVPSDGKPLLLLCDGQTTGGYKRVAVVAWEDLPLAGQLRPGSRVVFRLS